MKKSWGLIPKILSGEKTIESRWYMNRSAPWGKISKGDVIFFKDSGEPVTAKANVSEVLQFELNGLRAIQKIVRKYGKEIALRNPNPATWGKIPKYCILIKLRGAKQISPFKIDRTGYGSGAAWLTVSDIRDLQSKKRGS